MNANHLTQTLNHASIEAIDVYRRHDLTHEHTRSSVAPGTETMCTNALDLVTGRIAFDAGRDSTLADISTARVAPDRATEVPGSDSGRTPTTTSESSLAGIGDLIARTARTTTISGNGATGALNSGEAVTELHLGPTEPASEIDVFEAARWFDEMWNSSAKALDLNCIEWQCATWGSGRGHGDWEDVAIFTVVATAFRLMTSRNSDARDELLVYVPLDKFPQIRRVIERLDMEPAMWPWLEEELEEEFDDAISVAAELLELSVDEVKSIDGLLDVLRLE